MVHFVVGAAASELVLGEYTMAVGIESPGGLHADGDWLLGEDLSELLVVLTVFLDVADILDVIVSLQL